MNLTAYNQFTERLRQKLDDKDPRVLGLIAAWLHGPARLLCQTHWSDHDFFVITIQGVQEDMRQDLSWLPQADRATLSFSRNRTWPQSPIS